MPDGMSILAQARQLHTPDVTSQLRERELAVSKWSPNELEDLYYALVQMYSLEEIAEYCKKTTDDVIDEIARYGSWIRQGRKYSGFTVVWADEMGPKMRTDLQSRLFQTTGMVPGGTGTVRKEQVDALVDAHIQRAELRMGLGVKASKKNGPAPKKLFRVFGELSEEDQKRLRNREGVRDLGLLEVAADASFRPARLAGRDITGAMSAMFAAQPDRETAVRYKQRTSEREKVLTFEHVSLVWLFSRIGRLDDIGEVNGDSAALGHCFADGYDLLEVTRSSAMQALSALCEGGLSLQEVKDAIVRLRPLHESVADRIEGALRAAERGESRHLDRELLWLRRTVEANPLSIVVRDISEMRAGQVLRTAQAAGLHTGGSSRVEETEIRNQLQMLGLVGDADQLVPTGVAAVRAGLADTFWEAVERRADGDPKWDAELVVAMRRRS
jgi:hypothetical protein